MMIRITMITFAALITFSVNAQKFDTDIYMSPNVTFGSCENAENSTGFGFSVALGEYYHLSQKVSIGTEVNYTINKYKFSRLYDGFKIPEASLIYESEINTQSIKIPLNIRYVTGTNWILQAGAGADILINSGTKVNFAYSDGFNDEVIKTEIKSKDDKLINELSGYINIGLGKYFNVCGMKMFTEMYYEAELESYSFEHGGVFRSDEHYSYKIVPQQAGLKMGIGF